MAIKPPALNNREREMALTGRESGSGATDAALQDLQARLQRAKQNATVAQARTRLANRNKCECFERGWMAAIAEIETGGT